VLILEKSRYSSPNDCIYNLLLKVKYIEYPNINNPLKPLRLENKHSFDFFILKKNNLFFNSNSILILFVLKKPPKVPQITIFVFLILKNASGGVRL